MELLIKNGVYSFSVRLRDKIINVSSSSFDDFCKKKYKTLMIIKDELLESINCLKDSDSEFSKYYINLLYESLDDVELELEYLLDDVYKKRNFVREK